MTDWSVLGRSDPAPGDVEGTRELGQQLLRQAGQVEEQTGQLRALANDSGALKMAGDYAASYTEALTDLPTDLAKLEVAYRGAGSALVTFAGVLQQAKTTAGTALRDGEDADIRYRSAVRDLRLLLPAAQQNLVGTGLSLSPTSIEAATVGLDANTREQVRSAASRARTADADLDRARSLADQAAALRGEGEGSCAREINHALDSSGIKNKSWLQKTWHAATSPFRSWDNFVSFCGKVALVAGVAALIISGPIGIALGVVAALAGGAIFADGLMKYSAGEIGIGELALDGLGAIPGAGDVGAVARVGEEASAMSRVVGDAGRARTLLGSLGRGSRNVTTALPHALGKTGGIRAALRDPAQFGRTFKCRFLGRDPIDLATGEMVMTMTDLELPGVLPLVLQRTYSSAYGVGRWFGASWSSFLDQRLEVDRAGVCFAYTEAVLLSYPRVGPGESVLPDEGPRLPLSRLDDGRFTVVDPETGHTFWFAAPPEDVAGVPGGAGPAGVVLPLAGMSDRNGHRIDLHYDEVDGALAEIRHTGGYVIDVDTSQGRIISLRLRGRDGEMATSLLEYGYDSAGRLTSIVNSSVQPLRFTYDAENRITSWADRNGTWYRYTYDGAGRVVRTAGSAHCLDGELRYDDENRVTVEVNSVGAETAYHYNDRWQVERVVDPLGAATRFEWDRYHRKLSQTDPLGRTTRYAYDADGNLAEVTRPDGRRTRIDFDDQHQPVRIAQPDGTSWEYRYDPAGNLTVITDPLGAVTRYAYGDRGRLSTCTDPLGHSAIIGSDAAGLPVSVTDPLGATTRAERDAFGRVVAVTDPLGATTRYSWTPEGRLAGIVQPDGVTESWRYDGEGSLVEHVDALGQSTLIEQTYFDLPSVRTDVLGHQIAFTYDTELRLTSVTDPRGLVWRYDYDPAGRLIRETDYDGRILAYTYDAAGQLTRRVNGAGQAIAFTHDALGNVIRRESEDGVTTLTYDPLGRLTRAVNPDADVEFDRDPLGRVQAERTNGRTLFSTYDAAGQRIARRTPSGAESHWQYDAAGRPLTLTTADHITRFTYDAAGREIQRALGPAAVLTQSWSASRQLLTQTVSATRPESAGLPEAAEPVQHRAFGYDLHGRLTSITDRLRGQRTFELDPLDRILAVHTDATIEERFSYGPAGDLVPMESSVAVSAAEPQQPESRRVRRVGSLRYDYDQQGRVVRRRRKLLSGGHHTWHYTWNAEDRLTTVTTPDASTWQYRYDALGRRVAKQRLTPSGDVVETVSFTWDAGTLAERESTAEVTAWDWRPGEVRPLAQRRAGQDQSWFDAEFYFIVSDLVGTPMELLDERGEVAWRSTTSLWGAGLSGFGVADCPLAFPGQYRDDESGLSYNHHRYYDPDAASYISLDPLGLAAGLSPDTYVPNPLTWLDPIGLSPYSGAAGTGPKIIENETTAARPLKPGEATATWDEFLGGGPTTNIHPRTGLPDPNRIVSADGARSIRMGPHEMGSSPTRFHYHEETWSFDPGTNTWTIDNVMVRVPFPKGAW